MYGFFAKFSRMGTLYPYPTAMEIPETVLYKNIPYLSTVYDLQVSISQLTLASSKLLNKLHYNKKIS